MKFLFLLLTPVLAIFSGFDEIYNDSEARFLFELVASVHNKYPEKCLENSFKHLNSSKRPILLEYHDVRCDFLNSKCTFGFFENPAEKQLIIAIRGTQSMSQFFFEFLSAFIPDADFHGLGQINYYFYITHQIVWQKVKNLLELSKYKNYDVIFTGHSLGGSLATLSAFETVLSGLRNNSQVKLVSLAEPRTGNFRFAKSFDATVKYRFRVINGVDVLAHLPPCHKDFRYWPRTDIPCDPTSPTGPYHHGTEVWYPNGMEVGKEYVICDGSQGEEQFCSDKVEITMSNFGKGITDHRKYFGVMVSQYGKANCDRTRSFDENEGMLGKMKVISEFLNKIL